jgi:hypothetical protein
MDARIKKRRTFESKTESAENTALEQYLVDHHDEVEAQLEEARAEIAEDKAAPLEPLTDLLRDARRRRRAKPR